MIGRGLRFLAVQWTGYSDMLPHGNLDKTCFNVLLRSQELRHLQNLPPQLDQPSKGKLNTRQIATRANADIITMFGDQALVSGKVEEAAFY